MVSMDGTTVATGLQIRMARSGLKMSGKDLAEASAVGLSTIRKIEAADGLAPVHLSNLQSVTEYLLRSGKVRFEGTTGVFVEPE